MNLEEAKENLLKEVITPSGKMILYGINCLPNSDGLGLIFYNETKQQIYFSEDCEVIKTLWSVREIEVSPEVKNDCAVYQMVLDFKNEYADRGTAFLFSDEYSNRESASWIKERMEKIASILNKNNSIKAD